MAKSEKAKSKKASGKREPDSIKKSGKRLDISALAVIDNIVFNKTSAMAYYRIETDMYDYLSTRAKVGNGMATARAISDIMAERSEPTEVHLFNTASPLDIDAWKMQMYETTSDWRTSPKFDSYINSMASHLEVQDFIQKRAYIGIDLGKRGSLDVSMMNPFEAGVKAAVDTFKAWSGTIFSQYGEDVSASEEAEFRRKEADVYRIVSGTKFRAKRVSSEELLLLMKRQFYPAMLPPYLNVDHGDRYSAGDLVYELDSVIENNYRWLKFKQLQSLTPTSPLEELEGYRATLTLTSFSREWNYAEEQHPFLYYPETQTGEVHTSFARLTFIPRENMKKKIDNKKKEMEDELKSFQTGMTDNSSVVNSNEDLSSAVMDLQEMDAEITESRSAWVKGSYHIVVEASTIDGLKNKVQAIKQILSPDDIVVLHTAGDQMDLFLEQMPGDYRRVKSFDQTSNINLVAASGFNIANQAGDDIKTADATTYKDRLAISEAAGQRRG